MHPKSKDRSGNDKVLRDAHKQQGLPPPGDGSRLRDSPMGRRLRALREKHERMAASED